MKKVKLYAMIPIILVLFVNLNSNVAYIPEGEVIVEQIPLQTSVKAEANMTVAIIVKNYLNITLTNVTLSLNITDRTDLRFTGCDFGVLTGDNVTLNETIQSADDNGFTAYDITEGFLSDNYLEANISQIVNGTKFILKYNITADIEGDYSIPRVRLSYLDEWEDRIRVQSDREIQIDITPKEEIWNPDLPRWMDGSPISLGLGVLVFCIVPAVVAIGITAIFSFRRRG